MEFPTPEELPYSLVLNGNPYRVEGERRYSCPRINPGYSQKTSEQKRKKSVIFASSNERKKSSCA
jgi:hypothetical protein